MANRREVRYIRVTDKTGAIRWRRYIVWSDRDRDDQRLVIAYHPGTSSDHHWEQETDLHLVLGDDYAVVYPNGHHGTWNAGRCCGRALADDVDDIAFHRALLAKMGREKALITGFSNGGRLCYHLLSVAPETVEALAPVGSCPEIMFGDGCKNRVPIFHMHGLWDRAGPLGGGKSIVTTAPVQDSVIGELEKIIVERGSKWSDAKTTLGDADDELILAFDWDAPRVRLWLLPEMGHVWPGSGEAENSFEEFLGPQNMNYPATMYVADFFNGLPKE